MIEFLALYGSATLIVTLFVGIAIFFESQIP